MLVLSCGMAVSLSNPCCAARPARARRDMSCRTCTPRATASSQMNTFIL